MADIDKRRELATIDTPPPLVSSAWVSEFLDIPLGTLNQWAARGIGPPFLKVGRHRRYVQSELLDWVEERRAFPAPPEPAVAFSSRARRHVAARPRPPKGAA